MTDWDARPVTPIALPISLEFGGGELRQVASPLTDEMLAPAKTGRGVVQFDRLLTDEDFGRLAEWLRQYPEMTLRAYGSYDRSIRDVEFLRFFPTLRGFDVDAVYLLESIDGLRYLPDTLEELAIGATKRTLDVSIIGRFRSLRSLHLERQMKGIEVIAGLTSLEDLTLRSVTLPDLSLLTSLDRLLSLDLKLGGTKDLRLLPKVGRLHYLELWLIRGLADISAVGELPEVRYLFLQALKQVEQLPDLGGCLALRRIHLETMKGIRDLRPLATAPALEEIVLVDMPQLQPEDVRPLAGLPNLKFATFGFGSQRRNGEAEAIVGLPAVNWRFDWRGERPLD